MAPEIETQEYVEKASAVVARAWTDPAFKKRLVKDPRAVLAELGFPLPPDGVEVRVVENTPTVRYLVLPALPASVDLPDEGVGDRTGGYGFAPTFGNFGALQAAAAGSFSEPLVLTLWPPA